MEKITSINQLKESISLLEIKQANDARLLKEQFNITYESIQPVNLIKSTLHDLITSPNLKENMLNGALSMAAGYFSKKAAIGSTHNPLKQLLGTLLQMGVTGIVSKNADGIKSTVMQLLSTVFRNKNA